MKILIIEDDKSALSLLKNYLKNMGFLVSAYNNGKEGLEEILTNINDLIIVDLNLPDISGYQVCKQARLKKIMIPILILSGENESSTKVKLLDLGADDYLVKPYCFEELLARINSLLRRPSEISQNIIKIRDLKLDLSDQSVKRNKDEIPLTRREYLILELLSTKQGNIVSRAEIFEKAWDNEIDFFSNAIETHILNIRNKIDKPYQVKLLKTISGRGYKIG